MPRPGCGWQLGRGIRIIVYTPPFYHQIPPDTTRYHQMSPDTTRYHQIPPDVTRYHQIPPDTTRYHQIPPDTQGPGPGAIGARTGASCK